MVKSHVPILTIGFAIELYITKRKDYENIGNGRTPNHVEANKRNREAIGFDAK